MVLGVWETAGFYTQVMVCTGTGGGLLHVGLVRRLMHMQNACDTLVASFLLWCRGRLLMCAGMVQAMETWRQRQRWVNTCMQHHAT